MCDLKSGKGRCSYHIKESMLALEASETKEILKAAEESGVSIPPAPTQFDASEELRIKENARNDPKVVKAKKNMVEANQALNKALNDYTSALDLKEVPVMASHLYTTSNEGRATQARMEDLKANFKTEMDDIMDTPAMKKHVAKHSAMLDAEVTVEASRQKMELMKASRTARDSEKTFAVNFWKRDAQAYKEAQIAYAGSSRENRESLIAARSLRAETDKEKNALLRDRVRAKGKATLLATHALEGDNKNDPDRFRFKSGPMAGKMPEGLTYAKNQLLIAKDEHKRTLATAEKREMKKAGHEIQSSTPEFEKFKKDGFDKTKRGKDYHQKSKDLRRDYMMMQEFRDATEKKIASMEASNTGTVSIKKTI